MFNKTIINRSKKALVKAMERAATSASKAVVTYVHDVAEGIEPDTDWDEIEAACAGDDFIGQIVATGIIAEVSKYTFRKRLRRALDVHVVVGKTFKTLGAYEAAWLKAYPELAKEEAAKKAKAETARKAKKATTGKAAKGQTPESMIVAGCIAMGLDKAQAQVVYNLAKTLKAA